MDSNLQKVTEDPTSLRALYRELKQLYFCIIAKSSVEGLAIKRTQGAACVAGINSYRLTHDVLKNACGLNSS